MGFWNTILALLFPEKCLGCGTRDTPLCASCCSIFPAAERESAKWIFPIYDYRHPGVKNALWFFKYNGKKNLAKVFAERIYEKMLEEISELAVMQNFREPMLVPIPLSSKRLRERGYNQSELICREILKLANIRDSVYLYLENNVLYKPHDTEHQARIKDRRARLQNMRGTFAVKNGENICGRNIILVDDILTTGATLSEARRVLREAGARKVIAFTVAH